MTGVYHQHLRVSSRNSKQHGELQNLANKNFGGRNRLIGEKRKMEAMKPAFARHKIKD